MRWTPWLMTAMLAAGCASGPSKDDDTDIVTDESDSDTGTGDTDVKDTSIIADDSGGPADTDPPDTDVPDTDPNACGPGEVRDCNDQCFSQIIIGDNFCDDGPLPQADFDCPLFQADDGDCSGAQDTDDTDDVVIDTGLSDEPCTGLYEVRDCNGLCYPQTWIGDERCDQGETFPWGSPDFDCAGHEHDLGDCAPDTSIPTETADTADTDVADTDVLDTDVSPVDTFDTYDTAIISFDTWPSAPDTWDTFGESFDTDLVPVDTDLVPADTDRLP